MAEQEKISRVVVEDPHGNTIVDREISTVERETVIAEHNASETAHPHIQGLVADAEQHSTDKVAAHNLSEEAHPHIQGLVGDALSEAESKIEQIYVGDESVVQTDQQGKKYVRFQKDQFGKVDGIKVNDGEDLPIDEDGKVSIPVPTTVKELSDSADYATKEDAQGYVDAAKITTATATADNSVGTPRVVPTINGQNIHFDIYGIKGEKGNDGDTVILNTEPGDPTEPNHYKLYSELGGNTDGAMTQKSVSDALLPVLGIDNRWTWRDGVRMHVGTPSTLKSDANFQTSYPLAVEVGDVVEVTTAGDGTITFAVIAYLATVDAGTWTKKAGHEVAASTTNTYRWTSNANGFVVVCGLKEGMSAKIIKANRLAKYDELEAVTDELTDELEKRANEIEDELKVGYLKYYDLSIINRIQLYPLPSTNKWDDKIGSDDPYGIMVEVVPGDTLRLSVPNSNRGVYCFLKDYTAIKGDRVDYATGCAYETLKEGQTVNLVVPSDAHRLYLLVGKGDTSYQYAVAANVKNSAKEFIGEEIDFGSHARYDKYISSSNVWTAGYSEYNRCVLIPVSKGDVYYIKPTNVGCIIAFLSENTNVGSPVKFANGLASRIQLSSPALLTVPDNATLLYVFDNTKGIPMLPLCVNISKSPFGQAVKAGHGMYGTPIYHIVTQGYYSRTGDDMHININSDLVTRVKIGTSAITGAFRIVLNEGYHLRAVYSFDASNFNGEQIVYDSEGLTDYTFIPSSDKPIAAVTICKDDATQSISPSEDIVKFFGAPEIGLLEQVTDSKIIKKAVFLGDSITHGVYSYYDQDIHDDNHRYNGFDITDLSDVAMATRYHCIPYYFGLFADCECINIAKRGSGWVQDGRNIGNAYEVASAYDFSDVNFCALCFGINDYINGISIGDIETMAADTLIGNMSLVFSKIFSDNPLCKVVVYSPYNCWGQVSHGGDYVSDVLYGNESTDYALGFDKGGGTLQEYIDAIDSVCQYYGVQHVPLSKSNIVNRLTLKNIMIDGLHPSKDSFRALAAEIYGKGNFGD